VTDPAGLTNPAGVTDLANVPPTASFDVEIPQGRLRGEESGSGTAVVLIHGFRSGGAGGVGAVRSL
jgi:hypothetical protein